jgi:hypothetical protein
MKYFDKSVKSDRIKGNEKKLLKLRKKVNELFFNHHLSKSMIAKKKRVSRNFVAKWTKAPTQDFTNGKYKPKDLPRMRKGLAPQRINPRTGKLESKQLHHLRGRNTFDPHNPKYLKPLWPDEHIRIHFHR